MWTTVELDDALVEEARRLTGTTATRALLADALRALIQRESAARWALLGGSDPSASVPERRRTSAR